MTSNISFGSTYIVSNRDNSFNNVAKFQDFALKQEAKREQDGVRAILKDSISSKYPYQYDVQYTLIAPDKMDNEIERFCSYNGIEFSRLSNDYLLDPTKIEKRIELPKKKQVRTTINVDRLEKLIQTQSSNFEHCQKDYEKYYKDDVEAMLKSGEAIPATTLHITPLSSDTGNLIEYIRKYGAESLNDNQARFDFCQHTDKPDHCVYFALRDLGMQKVPIYLDCDSYEIGLALGLFK